jgi:gamma-glutamyl phosphate reductase
MDCVIVDRAIAAEFLPMLKEDFIKWNVEVYADEASYPIFEGKSDLPDASTRPTPGFWAGVFGL